MRRGEFQATLDALKDIKQADTAFASTTNRITFTGMMATRTPCDARTMTKLFMYFQLSAIAVVDLSSPSRGSAESDAFAARPVW